MIFISRREHFNAAHKLYNPKWGIKKNIEIFGACANENWHGHNYELIVTVKGEPNPETGFVVDLKKLGDLIKSEVIEKVDHKNLNLDVDFMEGKLTSCENLIIEIWKILQPAVANITPYGQLHCLKLTETPKNFIEYYG
jgi:6-pyruvoyltetrahydropterin/6-carboxytetrahydropterin synthase